MKSHERKLFVAEEAATRGPLRSLATSAWPSCTPTGLGFVVLALPPGVLLSICSRARTAYVLGGATITPRHSRPSPTTSRERSTMRPSPCLHSGSEGVVSKNTPLTTLLSLVSNTSPPPQPCCASSDRHANKTGHSGLRVRRIALLLRQLHLQPSRSTKPASSRETVPSSGCSISNHRSASATSRPSRHVNRHISHCTSSASSPTIGDPCDSASGHPIPASAGLVLTRTRETKGLSALVTSGTSMNQRVDVPRPPIRSVTNRCTREGIRNLFDRRRTSVHAPHSKSCARQAQPACAQHRSCTHRHIAPVDASVEEGARVHGRGTPRRSQPFLPLPVPPCHRNGTPTLRRERVLALADSWAGGWLTFA